MTTKFSRFIAKDVIADSDYINVTSSSVNRRVVWPDFLANVYDRIVTPFIYPNIVALQEAPLRADEDDPVYVRVEETQYRLYKITNVAPGVDDIVLNNGNTASVQTEYRDIGFVVGPDASAVGAIALFDNTTGTLLASGPTPSSVGLDLLEFPNSATDGFFRKLNDNSVELVTSSEMRSLLSVNNVDNTSDADKPVSNATSAFVQSELANRVQYVATIAALRNLTGLTSGQKVKVAGYLSGSLKGGGDFTVSSDVVTADNGITVFVTTDGVRVYRDDVGVVTPFMGGAVGDGATDDTVAFNRCDATALDIYVPVATYIVEGATLTGKKMYGGGTLKWKGGVTGITPALYMRSGAKLHGVTIDGNKANNLFTQSSRPAVQLQNSKFSDVSNVSFINLPTVGLRTDLNNSTDLSVKNCTFRLANKGCIEILSSRSNITGCQFYATGINDGHAIRFGRYGSDAPTVIRDHVVSGCSFKYVNSTAVLVEVDAQNVTVTGCTISNMSGCIKVEYQPETNVRGVVFVGNYIEDVNYFGSYDEGTDTWTTSAVPMSAPIFGADDCVCVGNQWVRCAGIRGGANALIADNKLTDCGNTQNSAVLWASSGPTKFIDNIVYMDPATTTSSVIDVSAFGSSTIEGNEIYTANGVLRGIHLALANNIVRFNKIYDCPIGINIVSSLTGSTIKGNIIDSSVTTAINSSSGISNTNRISDNDGANDFIFNYTIASGAIAINGEATRVRLDTEGAASADDLVNITGGRPGQIVTFEAASSARDITFVNSTGNLEIGSDFTTASTANKITLICNGTDWGQIFRV